MSIHSIVIVREVWDTRDLATDVVGGDGKLMPGVLTHRFEPEDLNSLEQALQLKEEHGGRVTVLSAGTTAEVDVLRESLYRGVDDVYRIVPPEGAALDTAATAALLAGGIEKVGAYDVILLGVSLPEDENSLLGAELAARLGVDQLSYVDSLSEVNEQGFLCKREVEMGSEYLRVPRGSVLVLGVYLLKDDPRTPRSAKAMLKLKMKKKPIEEWSAADLGITDLAAGITTSVVTHEAVPPREVDSTTVDPENEAELKTMLQDILGR